MDGQAVKEASASHETCFPCPAACRPIPRVHCRECAGVGSKGPGYESLFAPGNNLAQCPLGPDPRGPWVVHPLRVDTVSTGNVIGFALECYEEGILALRSL